MISLKVGGLCPEQYDQFFTNTNIAQSCVQFLLDYLKTIRQSNDINDTLFIDPACGTGAFVNALLNANVPLNNIAYVDIDATDATVRHDFLKMNISQLFTLHDQKYDVRIVIGNPPFGQNSNLAVGFINKAAHFADVVAFILPLTFAKPVFCNRLDARMVLCQQIRLPKMSFMYDNQPYGISTIFQIWINCESCLATNANVTGPRALHPQKFHTKDFEFVKRDDDPHFAMRRVGKNAGRVFATNLSTRSTSSHIFIKCRPHVEIKTVWDRLLGLDLENTLCKFDTAGCPSLSKNELCSLYDNDVTSTFAVI